MSEQTGSETDPNAIGWMEGFPPSSEKVIRFADGTYYAWPQLRWTFSHIDQLVPMKNVWRGAGAAWDLPIDRVDFSDLAIDVGGVQRSWNEVLDSTYTDGLVVLHRGRVVFEEYFGAGGPHTPHLVMSANKSVVGTLAECLIDEGRLDPDALVPTVVPELADSAWGDATVRQVLNMEIGMHFEENYLDPASEIYRFMRCTGMMPYAPDTEAESIADYLMSIEKEGDHGHSFAYREPNIFALGWIVRRASGQDLASDVSERIWQRIGAEHDYTFMVDSTGAETTGSATLRDFVRFGELICNGGRLGDEQILPAAAVASIMGGGDPEVFARGGMETLPGWSYRSQWWIRHIGERVCPVARGAHGQFLYVDPTNELVIGRYGSAREAPSALLDHVVLPLFDAITAALLD